MGRFMRRLAALALLLLAAASPAVSAERKVSATLLVFSDIYEMSEQNGRGGFARVAGVLAAERAKSGNTLVAFAGDTLSPSLLSSLDKGAHIIDLHNRTKIDVFTPGNHEFDFGEDVFRTRMAELQAIRLAANLRDRDGKPLPGFADNKIFVMDGVKIGVFGLTEDESAKRSNTGTLRVSSAVETARAQARRLRDAGADLVVAVTHSDWKDDLRLAKTGDIDVILSGHDHNLAVFYDGHTAIAETQADGAQVVAVDLTITITGADDARRVGWTPKFRVIDTADATPDAAVAARVAEIAASMDKGLDEPIGVTQTQLDARKASVRGRETALGEFSCQLDARANGRRRRHRQWRRHSRRRDHRGGLQALAQDRARRASLREPAGDGGTVRRGSARGARERVLENSTMTPAVCANLRRARGRKARRRSGVAADLRDDRRQAARRRARLQGRHQ